MVEHPEGTKSGGLSAAEIILDVFAVAFLFVLSAFLFIAFVVIAKGAARFLLEATTALKDIVDASRWATLFGTGVMMLFIGRTLAGPFLRRLAVLLGGLALATGFALMAFLG